MTGCQFCNDEILPVERVTELGKTFCTAKACVSRWLREEKLTHFRLVLLPKQGHAFVSVKDPVLTQGRSSGRS